MPPDPVVPELFVTVTKLSVTVSEEIMPPPLASALLPEIVELVTVSVPLDTAMPPPGAAVAELPEIVDLLMLECCDLSEKAQAAKE